MVPSVCFTVPPPNKEAVDFANRLVWFGVLLKVKEADSALSGTHRTGSSVELVHRGHFRNEDCSMFSEGAKRLKKSVFSCICYRIEQQYQSVLALWHESHINMKSVVSWHYLVNEIDRIRASNVASVSTNVHINPVFPLDCLHGLLYTHTHVCFLIYVCIRGDASHMREILCFLSP